MDGKTSEVAALLSEALGGLHGVQIEAVDAGAPRDVQIDFLAGFTVRSRRFSPSLTTTFTVRVPAELTLRRTVAGRGSEVGLLKSWRRETTGESPGRRWT